MLADQISANIQRLREARNWSRPELAKRCVPPTSGQQIERLEKGQRQLTLDWVERVARGLGVEPIELIAPERQSRGFTLGEQVASEVARILAVVAREGEEPENGTVQALALMLQELTAMFSEHPQAATDPQVARPAIALAGRRYGPAAN